jgi:hypothetical protein
MSLETHTHISGSSLPFLDMDDPTENNIDLAVTALPSEWSS